MKQKKQEPIPVCTREEAMVLLESSVGVMDCARTYLKTAAFHALTNAVAMPKEFALQLAKAVAELGNVSRLALDKSVKVIRDRETKGRGKKR